MKVKIKQGTFLVRFEHTENGKTYKHGDVEVIASIQHPLGLPVRAKTRCVIVEATPMKSVVGWGEAWCSVKDRFDKERGRKIALGRALKAGEFGKEEREKFWEAYFERE